MRLKCGGIAEKLRHLVDLRGVRARGNVESQASRLGAGQAQMVGQMCLDQRDIFGRQTGERATEPDHVAASVCRLRPSRASAARFIIWYSSQ